MLFGGVGPMPPAVAFGGTGPMCREVALPALLPGPERPLFRLLVWWVSCGGDIELERLPCVSRPLSFGDTLCCLCSLGIPFCRSPG